MSNPPTVGEGPEAHIALFDANGICQCPHHWGSSSPKSEDTHRAAGEGEDLISRQDVLSYLCRRAEEHADMALSGGSHSRRREGMEAAFAEAAKTVAALSATQQPVSEGVGWNLPLHSESAAVIKALKNEARRTGKGVPEDYPGFHKTLWTAALIIEAAEEAYRHQMQWAFRSAPNPIGEEKGAES